jgi:chromosome segregation ATPase
MTVDYEALDAELDAEIQKMYSEDDSASDAPEDSGTASEDPEAVVQEAESATPSTDEQQTETTDPVVPEHRYKEAVRAMNKAQQELAEFRKADANRDQTIQQLQAELQALKSNEAPEPDAYEDLSEAKELYPELVAPLLKTIDSLKKQLASVQNEVSGVKTVADRYQQAEAMSAEERHYAEINNAHPDVSELVATEEFQAWRNAQAPVIQYALDQGTARDVVAALSLYKSETGKASTSAPVSNKPDRLAAAKDAASPSIKGASKPDSKPTFTADQIAKMTMSEFAKHEAEIDAAIARGELY